MSILSVDNIQPIGSGTTVTVNKSVTLESGNTNITGVCTATSFSGSGANLTSLPSQVTIANNGDNRIITGGSGTNLNGEAGLTFDGTNLDLGASKPIRLGGGNDLEIFHNNDDAYIRNNTGALILRNNGQSGDADASQIYIQATPAENSIQCSPNGAVILFHDNSIRLSTTSTGAEITGSLVRVRSSSATTFTIGSNNASGAILALDGDSDGNGSGSDYAYFEHDSNGDLNIVQDNPAAGGKIEFYTGGAARVSMQSDKLRPANNEGMTLGTSGLRWGDVYTSGINFAHTSDASGMSNELLDDYEEGSWSPDIVISNGTSVVSSFAWRTGKYTKVGNLVHCTFAMGLNGINSGSSLRLGGIPFAPAGITYFYYFVLHGYSYASGFGDSGNTTRLFGEINATLGSQIQIVKGTGRNTVSNSDIGTGQRFTGMFHYYTA